MPSSLRGCIGRKVILTPIKNLTKNTQEKHRHKSTTPLSKKIRPPWREHNGNARPHNRCRAKKIYTGSRKDQPSDSTYCKKPNKKDAPNNSNCKLNSPGTKMADPRKNLDTSGYPNNYCGGSKITLTVSVHSYRKHVMGPNYKS